MELVAAAALGAVAVVAVMESAATLGAGVNSSGSTGIRRGWYQQWLRIQRLTG